MFNLKEYRKNNKERLKRQRQLLKDYNDGVNREFSDSNCLMSLRLKLLRTAKKRAALKGMEFNLTIDDIQVPYKCSYLGIVLTYIQGQWHVHSNASIDRIDSDKGYIKGNIQIISHLANKMKQDASIEQLKSFAKGVLRTHGRITGNQISS